MSLTSSEFRVLAALVKGGVDSQRALADAAGISLGLVNKTYRALQECGLVEAFAPTAAGMEALEPYKVRNAVIMAAGLSSRFAPISYERPKGVLRVRGEVLIERQIRQLHEAGITDITVVVGYMKEAFFYLEERFGVKIRVNADYQTRNNNSSLMLVADQLDNTYICSSDNYFAENVFEPYVYKAYYAATYVEGETDEYCITCGTGKRITRVDVGGRDSYIMLGHVYFDRAFSKGFVAALRADYDLPETAGKLWEDIYIDHIDQLDMVMRPYDAGVVNEFDSLMELKQFDPDFITNVDSAILDNICATLFCKRGDIAGIVPIKQGLTNLSFRFDYLGRPYVYRHPGAGTDEIINRTSETISQAVAKKLEIDDTFVYEDADKGWKISKFVPGCVEFDYHNEDHVRRGLALGRKLHRSGDSTEWEFDVYRKAVEIVELLAGRAYPSFDDYDMLQDMAARLYACVKSDEVPPCLCHNDFYAPNFLVGDDFMHLIDWEYSAMSDYASDLGTFICCSDYTVDEADQVLAIYFERTPTPEERRHCLAYVALCAFYWFVWALYKEAQGDPVGEWLYLWYRHARDYGRLALSLYEEGE